MRTLIKRSADQFDTIEAMKKYALIGSKDIFFKKFIQDYNLKPDLNSIKKICKYIFDNVYFEPDPPNKQKIRYGTRAFKDGYGNCVDYSVLLSQFLLNLKIPHSFMMVCTDKKNPENYNHIFVVIDKNNLPLDLVIGQDQVNKSLNNRHMILFKSVPFYNSAKLKVY